MVYCVECGTSNDNSARFCTKCGAELYIPDELSDSVPSDEESVVVAKEEEPKKRGRKPKTQKEEVPEQISDDIEIKEIPAETIEVEAVESVIKNEPEALEWGTTKSESTKGYVPPAMPGAKVEVHDRYQAQQATYNPYIATPVNVNGKKGLDNKTKPISTGAYFWLRVLYSIPGVGLIVMIILSVAPANLNLKRFSRASLIYRVICYSTLLILFLALVIVWQHFGWVWYDEFCSYRGWHNWTVRIW